MEENILINHNETYKKDFNQKINPTITKLAMALGMAAITGICAQIVIPLHWTPVPITLQTFAVLISGVLLGKKLGYYRKWKKVINTHFDITK